MSTQIAKFLIIFICIEFFSVFIYLVLGRTLFKDISNTDKISPILKGAIERFCLSAGLILGVNTVLVAFGALKVATKLSPSKEQGGIHEKASNDYYIIGNLISITIALFEYYCYKLNVFSINELLGM